MRKEVKAIFLLVFILLASALVFAETEVSIKNAPPQIIPVSVNLTGVVNIQDFSFDPNNDPYTCYYCILLGSSSYCKASCSIDFPFSSGNYTIDITLDDGVNSSREIITITYDIDFVPPVTPPSSGGSGGGSSGYYVPPVTPGDKEDVGKEVDDKDAENKIDRPQKENPIVKIREFISNLGDKDSAQLRKICREQGFMTWYEVLLLILLLILIAFGFQKIKKFDKKLKKKINHLKKTSQELKKHHYGDFHSIIHHKKKKSKKPSSKIKDKTKSRSTKFKINRSKKKEEPVMNY